MKLKEIAHSRTGDKGEISNISVIPYRESDYEWLKKVLTAERVKGYFSDICHGEVVCYALDGIHGLNFVLDKTLGGGVTRSLALDKHGKTLGMALLEMDIEVPDNWKSPLTGEYLRENDSVTVIDGKKIINEKLSYNGSKAPKSIRIGSGAGFAGDRLEPALELIEKGKLDYIIFECLAERTVALGQQAKEKDKDKGYNPLLEYRMKKVLPLASKNHVKVITNMGAANPKAAAEQTKRLAEELKIEDLKIACVIGDDITEQLEEYGENDVLENGKKLKEMKDCLISANVYMGAEGIISALEQGADVVITGRVSDPALSIGPLVYEFGWNIEKNPEQMGQAVLIGHLLECAGQVTGGYFADPGYKDVPDLEHLGFPLIEVDESGSFIVSKVHGSGGLVSADTCKEQMVYEIHNPRAYLTPDAIADFSQVSFNQVGENTVRAAGAVSHGRPDTLKVSIGYKDCYIGEGEISYGGSGCVERAKLAAQIIERRIALTGIQLSEYRVDLIGWDSLYRDRISKELGNRQEPHEIRLRISGRSDSRLQAELLANEIEALYTNGPAGGGVVKKVSEIVSVCSIFVPRECVRPEVHIY